MKKTEVMYHIKTITFVITFSSLVFTIGAWVLSPHARSFVKDIYGEESAPLCFKLDNLIQVSEAHRKQTRNDLDRVIFILLESIPEEQRQKAIKKYEAFYGEKREKEKTK